MTKFDEYFNRFVMENYFDSSLISTDDRRNVNNKAELFLQIKRVLRTGLSVATASAFSKDTDVILLTTAEITAMKKIAVGFNSS